MPGWHRRLAGAVRPGHPEAPNVPPVDLGQGRITAAPGVVAVGGPVSSGLPLPLNGGKAAEDQQREEAESGPDREVGAHRLAAASIFRWRNQQNQPRYFSCSSGFIQSLPVTVPRQ